jgi:hypothetical protein
MAEGNQLSDEPRDYPFGAAIELGGGVAPGRRHDRQIWYAAQSDAATRRWANHIRHARAHG